jgi:hypothetical protein
MSLAKAFRKTVRAIGRGVATASGAGAYLPPSGPNAPPGVGGGDMYATFPSLPPAPATRLSTAGAAGVIGSAAGQLARYIGARGGAAAIGTAISRRVGRRGLQVVSKRAARALGYVTLGGLVYDLAGNLVGETSTRRMNPLNAKALNRSIRRVCAAKKISKKIEKLTGTSPRRKAVCAPRARKC